ncbi:MAG: ATP synthase subunit C [Spirochaetaceae bacterium]
MNIKSFKKRVSISFFITAGFMIVFSFLTPTPVSAETSEKSVVVANEQVENVMAKKWAFISAAIAFGLGAIGAAIAISNVGAAAMGAMSEKPEIGSQALIFIALAEGLVVFGFITALMILSRI